MLTEPTPAMCHRLLAEVDFDHRITGVKMAAMGGANSMPLYSLAEVASFIHVDSLEVLNEDRNAMVGYIDPSALQQWLREVLGDEDLAEAVHQESAKAEFYGNIALPIKTVLEDRLRQCLAVLSDGPQAEEADVAGS